MTRQPYFTRRYNPDLEQWEYWNGSCWRRSLVQATGQGYVLDYDETWAEPFDPAWT